MIEQNQEIEKLVKDYNEVSKKKRRLLFRILRRRLNNFWLYNKKKILYSLIITSIVFILGVLAFYNKTKILTVDNSTHNIVYVDTINTFENYCLQLQKLESNHNHLARREYIIIDNNSRGNDTIKFYSQYIGLYQIGKNERNILGYNDEFQYWNSRKLQEESIVKWLKYLKKQLKPYIEKYDKKWVGRYYITESGILSMAHLCGVGATMKFLDSKGTDKDIPKDGNLQRGTDYLLLFNRYNLNLDD
jgi:hypothetical protein